MADKAIALALAGGLGVYFRPLQQHIDVYTQKPILSATLLATGIALVALSAFTTQLLTAWKFAWNCFFRPLGKSSNQEGRLNQFYQGQAAVSSMRA